MSLGLECVYLERKEAHAIFAVPRGSVLSWIDSKMDCMRSLLFFIPFRFLWGYLTRVDPGVLREISVKLDPV